MFQSNLLKAAMVKRGVTVKSMAQLIGINKSTFYRKMQKNGNFTREEVNSIIDHLELAPDEYEAIFFAK